MGNVYVKKASGPAGIVGDLATQLFGGSKQEVAEAAALNQLDNFDYDRNPLAKPLHGDPKAGKWGPKDRHGRKTWLPADATGRHDMRTQEALTSAAARGIPYARLLSLGLGGLSAIDSLAEAQPGQSGLGMLHNAATRGYFSHLGAKSFLDPMAAGAFARHGRRKLERDNEFSLRPPLPFGTAHAPAPPAPAPPAPAPPAPPPRIPTIHAPTRFPWETTTTLPDSTAILSAPDLTNVTPDPIIEETVQNPSAKSGTEIMQEWLPLQQYDTTPVSPTGNQAGATQPGVDEHSAEAQKLLMENMANQEYWEQFGG